MQAFSDRYTNSCLESGAGSSAEMKFPWSEDFRWYALVAGLAGMLAFLGILQYRSAKAVSAATREQMRANLRGSLMDVRQALERELRPLCRELDVPPAPSAQAELGRISTRFDNWRSAATHPTLVKAVYVWQPSHDEASRLLTIKSVGKTFEPVSSQSDLTQLQTRLTEMVDASALPPAHPVPDNEGHPPAAGGRETDRPADNPVSTASGQPSPTMQRKGQPHVDRPMGMLSWMIDQEVPALVHPLYALPLRGAEKPTHTPTAWIIIVLDRTVLGEHILPELIQRYFGTNEQSPYEVAVVDKNAHAPDLYRSGPKLSSNFRVPDAALNLFGRPSLLLVPGEPAWGGTFVPATPNPEHNSLPSSVPSALPDEPHMEGPPSLIVEPIRYDSGQDWEITARHRQGSVEAAVAALSRRNLLFNLAVLAVLAATMAMIIAASLRARRFGRLQMDFVANVSHELRTPLTGIVSSAQNMADGLIDDKQKVAIYGKAIVQEAQQLSELVEQILQFSAVHNKGERYTFQPVNVAEVLQFTLKNTSALIQSADVKVEQEVESGLPPVEVDFKALATCLQNLIGNAVKYGGTERWIGIRAWMTNSSKSHKEIRISVADRGIGIRPEDLGQIFEPFYRASEVAEAQIHGTGLGLPLAKKIAEAMGGRITVDSHLGRGSTFTVQLPVK